MHIECGLALGFPPIGITREITDVFFELPVALLAPPVPQVYLDQIENFVSATPTNERKVGIAVLDEPYWIGKLAWTPLRRRSFRCLLSPLGVVEGLRGMDRLLLRHFLQ